MTAPSDPIEAAVEAALLRQLPLVVDRIYDLGGPRAYSIKQVADRLGLSSRTVYRLISDGRIVTIPGVSPPRIAAIALETFIAGKAS